MSSSRISTSAMANTSTLDDDVLMSKEHKDIMREFRDQLVDNMYPDDLLNSLQAARVLSHRESSRIKEKGSAEAMNESLLDILIRKPDRAFHEFITALRESDQNHVANIIDKNKESTPKNKRDRGKNLQPSDDEDNFDATPSTSRKRKVGEIGVRLKTERLEFEEDNEDEVDRPYRKMTRRETEAREAEREILKEELDIKLLTIIKKELRNLENVVGSGISESSMAKRRVVMETLKDLQKYRREITSIGYGSVLFRVVCPTLYSLLELRRLCTSGRLARLAEKIFSIDDYREHHLTRVYLSVTIDPVEFNKCQEELEVKENLGISEKVLKENRFHENYARTGGIKGPSSFGVPESGGKFLEATPATEDLCLLKYLSLNSPPHKPAALPDDLPQLLAAETLNNLTTAQRRLMAPSTGNIDDFLCPKSLAGFPRGRSPNRPSIHRLDKRHQRRKRVSLSLSPMSKQNRARVTGFIKASRSQPSRLSDTTDIMQDTCNYSQTAVPFKRH